MGCRPTRKLSPTACALLHDPQNELFFSSASLWEVSIKRGLGRGDFLVDPRLLRRGLLDNDYSELPITSEHAVAADGLPPIHKDPFDRILVAQAMAEGITLLTVRLHSRPIPWAGPQSLTVGPSRVVESSYTKNGMENLKKLIGSISLG